MDKVLIALDYDPTAQNVAETGFSLAKSLGAEIILMHVISDPSLYFSGEHIIVMGFAGPEETTPGKADNAIDLKKTASLFLEKSKQYLGDKAILTLVKEGDIAESILTVVKDLHIDILVLGFHNRKGVGNVTLGSVAEKVSQQTSIPLLIVPIKLNK